jgi:hypothetical protein
MKIIVIYQTKSEYSRQVEEYIHDFKQKYYGSDIELLDIDGREGSDTANLYGNTQYPAFLVVSDNGSTQNIWQGGSLPLMDELAGYLRN